MVYDYAVNRFVRWRQHYRTCYNSNITDGSITDMSNYVRYIGAGAVAAGGIISLIKSLPLIVKTFKQAMKGYGKKADGEETRSTKDLPMTLVVLGIGVLAIIMWLIPAIPVNLLSAIIIIIFGFFFATVSSRMVGLVGSSNNPVSGMAIATLLISSRSEEHTSELQSR